MKKLFFLSLLLGTILGGYYLFRHLKKDAQAAEGEEVIIVEETGPEIRYDRTAVEEGDTFTTVAERLGIPYSEALAIVAASTDVFDFTRIRIGKEIAIVYEDDVRMRLEYEPHSESVITVDLTSVEYTTTSEAIAYDVEIASAEVTITNSMFASGIEAGLEELLILDFAEVFAWEMDFATQVQNGDSFKVVYEKRFRDGQPAGVGNILVASFTNVGVTSTAYGFEGGFYDEDGASLIRPFLKAPLSYSRITSGFSYSRFHPVIGRVTEHRAIDYAAPTGTPIMSVGDGTVVFAGWNTGYGNFIKVRHNETFQTHYAHLSKFAVSSGTRVSQGDVIGYVGSTGWSTGPHLHYEVQVNGTLVNPLNVEFPKGEELAEEKREEFEQERDRLKGLMR